MMKILAARTRNRLIPAFTITGKNILEIGVGNSSFSRIILEIDENNRLTAIDPFTDPEGEIPDFYDHDSNRKHVESLKNGFGERFTFINAESPSGLGGIPDNTFDWIFVDGNHQVDGVLADLTVAQRLCKPGGVIACHDFAVHDKAVENLQEVVEATQIYLSKHDGLLFYGIDLSVYSTSILIKEPYAESIKLLNDLLGQWSLFDFRSANHKLDNFKLAETLSVTDGVYTTSHQISLDNETADFETVSKRIFSGYYENISAKLL